MNEEGKYRELIQKMLEETEDAEILCFVYTVFKNLLK